MEVRPDAALSESTIAAWEKGSTPYPARLPKLAEVLAVDPVALQDELDRWVAARATGQTARPSKRRRVDVYPAPREATDPSA